jgi:beta-N-acetylglucosaminidase
MNKKIIAVSITATLVANTTVGGYAETLNFNNSLSTNEVQTNVFEVIKSPQIILLEKLVNEQRKINELKQKELEEKEKAIEKENNKKRIANVKFDSYDIGVPSGITVEEMRGILSESHYSNFIDLADAFVQGEKLYQVNAFALIAIPGLESGWNTSDRAKNGRNNIVGMDVQHNASRGSVYDSKHQCILDLAKQLRKYYLTPGAQYFNENCGTKAINFNYSADPNWYKQVDHIGDELVGIYNQKYRNK